MTPRGERTLSPPSKLQTPRNLQQRSSQTNLYTPRGIEKMNVRCHTIVPCTSQSGVENKFILQILFYKQHEDRVNLVPVAEYKYSDFMDYFWKSENAGGCSNHPETFDVNPKIMMRILKDGPKPRADVHIVLIRKGKNKFPIGYYVQEGRDKIGITKTWTQQCTIGDTHTLDKGVEYMIIPTTYTPAQLGEFRLVVYSDVPISIDKLPINPIE